MQGVSYDSLVGMCRLRIRSGDVILSKIEHKKQYLTISV